MTEAAGLDDSIGRYVLPITTLAAFLSPFGIFSLNVALPSIGSEFSMDAILMNWVTSIYLLVSSIFLVPFGKIADIYGRKRIFSYGIMTFTLASAGCALSGSATMLLSFRILQGIGAAAIYCIGATILTLVYPPGKLGRALGINVAAVYIGGSVGPFLGGFLTHRVGWRSIFAVSAVLGLIIIFFVFWKLKGEWIEKEKKFDLAGSILYMVTLLLVMVGFSHLSSAVGIWLLLPGLAGAAAFVKLETGRENPVLDVRLFRKNRVFALSNLATLINYSATFAVTFLLSLYLQYVKQLTPEKAGLIMIAQPVVQAVVSPIAGRLSDRVEPRIVASVGMVLTGAGLFMLGFLDYGTRVGFVLLSLVVLGAGFSLFSSPTINAVMSSVEHRFYGVASGMLGTMRGMGMVFSMGMTLWMFSMYIGKVQITPEIYPALLKCTKSGFNFFALLCFAGIFASYARGKVR
jgi:EmrB/QacA subfamily drug resistance transporter